MQQASEGADLAMHEVERKLNGWYNLDVDMEEYPSLHMYTWLGWDIREHVDFGDDCRSSYSHVNGELTSQTTVLMPEAFAECYQERVQTANVSQSLTTKYEMMACKHLGASFQVGMWAYGWGEGGVICPIVLHDKHHELHMHMCI